VLVQIVYICLVVLTLAASVMVVVSPHAVYSALYLVLSMVGIACLFVLMNAQLAAALQIIVYAGAIMVLFLFVIMLLNLGRQGPPPRRNRLVRWVGISLAGALIAQVGATVLALANVLPLSLAGVQAVSIQGVAVSLVTEYLYAFEMVSVLLLVAVVGSIVLARRRLIQGVDEPGPRKGEGS
jgi:NADH-quinone oxidoreductase subunit J